MMDSLRCKAKRKDNGAWVQGYYVCVDGERHCIFTGKTQQDNGAGIMQYECYEISVDSLCRCSGIADSTGKLIFEGDILRCVRCVPYTQGNACEPPEQFNEVVTFNKGLFFLKRCADDIAGSSWDYVFEVIGNRYDNPELLPSEETAD